MGMDIDMAPMQIDQPVIQQRAFGSAGVRYSDFLKLIKANMLEKVTFNSDGDQLLGVDVNGARIKIEALPDDPQLLTMLTKHKVRKSDMTIFFLFYINVFFNLGGCKCIAKTTSWGPS